MSEKEKKEFKGYRLHIRIHTKWVRYVKMTKFTNLFVKNKKQILEYNKYYSKQKNRHEG